MSETNVWFEPGEEVVVETAKVEIEPKQKDEEQVSDKKPTKTSKPKPKAKPKAKSATPKAKKAKPVSAKPKSTGVEKGDISKLFTRNDVARACQVNSAAVHYWIGHKQIEAPSIKVVGYKLKFYTKAEVDKIVLWYMKKITDEGSRGRGAKKRLAQAQEWRKKNHR